MASLKESPENLTYFLPPLRASLILLFLLLKNVTTSSKTGSGGGDLPRLFPEPLPIGPGGKTGASFNRRDTMLINDELMPTAAAIEAADRMAAELTEYILQTCQVRVHIEH